LLRIGVSAPYDPVHAVRAQTLPPYGVLHRVGAVAQLPDPMSVLQVPVHVERRKLSVLDFRQPQAVCCGARATCMAEDTVHGSSVDGVSVPLARQDLQTSKHLPQRLKLVSRNTLRTSCYCMERTRWASHATHAVHARIYRVSMLHELGANVPIQSRCGASPATPRREIDCITGRLLAAEHSSRTLVPFHDSLGSHCPLRGS
jgi:hypothetical protein